MFALDLIEEIQNENIKSGGFGFCIMKEGVLLRKRLMCLASA
jgi:hypothetical protein